MIRYSYNRCPYNNQRDLANWASNYFKEPLYKFKAMKKNRLYAIWHSISSKKEFVSNVLAM